MIIGFIKKWFSWVLFWKETPKIKSITSRELLSQVQTYQKSSLAMLLNLQCHLAVKDKEFKDK